ncbi:MAG: polysaccharide biosynthesis protein [Planctomycetota bacterium]|jgi:FlaA1/EpsC-like NDP-sugar epimerase
MAKKRRGLRRGLFRGKTVLVTGGTGTVGLALALRLLEREGAAVVRIFSRDEFKHSEAARLLERFGSERSALELKPKRTGPRVRFLIGNIRDRRRLSRALDGVDYVFHAAGLKHVPSCEYNPAEAVKTNILGVQNLVEAAVERGVRGVVNLSTDKAASPSNTMGASKLMGEKIVISGNYLQARGRTRFSSVRFGNVLGSRGSVLPIFREQIAAGGPVTVTNPDMTRFIISVDEAVDLCFDALGSAAGGEVFVRKMPAVKLGTLAKALIAEYAPVVKRKSSGIGIKVVGARPGETLHEEIVTDEEAPRSLETKANFIITPTFMFRRIDYRKAHRGARKCRAKAYNSGAERLLGLGEMRAFIRRAGLAEAGGLI